MASIWTDRAWGTDVCIYQDTATFAPGVIDFGVARMNISNGYPVKDNQFANHVQRFYDGFAVPMAYWVVNSAYYTDRQMNMSNLANMTNDKHTVLQCIIESLRAGDRWKAVGILWFDCELPGAGDVWNAAYLEDLRSRIVALQKAGQFPKVLLGVYSRKSWIDTQPAVQVWLEQHPEILIWGANYLTSFPGLKADSLAQVRAQRLPITGQTPRWFGDNQAKPKLYKRFWQYHGTAPGCQPVTCPEISGNGTPSGLDLDVCEYTRKELFALVGMTDRLGAVEPPPPPPPPVPPTDIEARLLALETRITSLETTRTAAREALNR